MAFKHPAITQALGNLMSLQPSLALDAMDELQRIDRLDDRNYAIMQEGLEIMNSPREWSTGRQQAYFKRLAALIKEWDSLRR